MKLEKAGWMAVVALVLVPAGVRGVATLDEDASGFYTVPPCRLVDTRNSASPLGGPLVDGVPKTVQVTGFCGIPDGAAAVVVSLSIVAPTARGNCRVYPGDVIPETSNINFTAGQARASHAIVPLGPDGKVTVYCTGAGPFTVHLILDLSGYFR